VEAILQEIQQARESKTPFLGICFGYQLAWIEYCRNIVGIKDATSAEFSEKGTFVVRKRNKLKVGLHDGENWWSNYYCDTSYDPNWTHQHGFFAVPFHPEYASSKKKPHHVLVDFLSYAKNS
jgi:CTP synthase (UTP-ammonia lyase)